MASALKFEKPGALFVEYRKAREGPNSFLVWVPNASFICLSGDEVVRRTKWSKSLETGAALRAWIDSVEGVNDAEITVGAAP